MHKFRGLGVAIITPFGANKEIDYIGLEKVLDFQIDGGINFLVVHGSTGEAATLSSEERRKSLDFILEKVEGRVPIVVGLGSNDTAATVEMISTWNDTDVSGLLVASPSYNKPTQEGIYQHFKAIANSTKLPIILYNVPGRTSSNMSADTTLRLARDFDNIVAIKEASGDLQQMMDIIHQKPSDFAVLSGDDPVSVALISMGGEGLISVLGNAYPSISASMIQAALDNDFERARNKCYQLNDITKLVFAEGNPAGIKEVMSQMGLCASYLRLPLTNVSSELRDKIIREMQEIEQSIIAH